MSALKRLPLRFVTIEGGEDFDGFTEVLPT
jgi:hypothetical protein